MDPKHDRKKKTAPEQTSFHCGISPVLGVISQRTSNNCQGVFIGRGTVVPLGSIGGSHGTWSSYPGNRIGCLPLFLGESGKAILQCCVTTPYVVSVVMAYAMEIVVVNLFWPLKSGRLYESFVGQLPEINPHYWLRMTRHWGDVIVIHPRWLPGVENVPVFFVPYMLNRLVRHKCMFMR